MSLYWGTYATQLEGGGDALREIFLKDENGESFADRLLDKMGNFYWQRTVREPVWSASGLPGQTAILSTGQFRYVSLEAWSQEKSKRRHIMPIAEKGRQNIINDYLMKGTALDIREGQKLATFVAALTDEQEKMLNEKRKNGAYGWKACSEAGIRIVDRFRNTILKPDGEWYSSNGSKRHPPESADSVPSELGVILGNIPEFT
jgi:hypothetical protein